MPSWWTCPCGTRNERRKQRCTNVECRRKRPAKRGPRHARILSGDTYPLFVQAARDIHGVYDEACCVCGKPRSQERRHGLQRAYAVVVDRSEGRSHRRVPFQGGGVLCR